MECMKGNGRKEAGREGCLVKREGGGGRGGHLKKKVEELPLRKKRKGRKIVKFRKQAIKKRKYAGRLHASKGGQRLTEERARAHKKPWDKVEVQKVGVGNQPLYPREEERQWRRGIRSKGTRGPSETGTHKKAGYSLGK